MKTVICKRYAGKPLATAHGVIQFDGNGLVELEDAAADKLATIPGFSIYAAESGNGEPSDKNHSTDPEHTKNGDGGTQEGENGGEGDQTDKDDTPGEQPDPDKQPDEDTDKGGFEDDPANDGKTAPEDNDPVAESGDTMDTEVLKKLTVPALKSMAKKKGLKVDGLTKKDEFISLLTKKDIAE